MRDTIATLFRAAKTFRTAPFRTAPRAMLAATLLAMACGLGACASGGAGNGSFAMAGGGTTVAFESIDRPPRRRGLVPRAKLSISPGPSRPYHDRVGLGRL